MDWKFGERKVKRMKNKKKDILSDKFIITVKVGPKGQITIPKEAREKYDNDWGYIR